MSGFFSARRRHHRIGVIGEDAGDQFALVGMAGSEDAAFDGAVAVVEPELRLARGTVRPVTAVAVIGENRANLAVEADLLLGVLAVETTSKSIRNVERAARLRRAVGFIPTGQV